MARKKFSPLDHFLEEDVLIIMKRAMLSERIDGEIYQSNGIRCRLKGYDEEYIYIGHNDVPGAFDALIARDEVAYIKFMQDNELLSISEEDGVH